MAVTEEPHAEEEHGIASASYLLAPAGWHKPTLFCTCGEIGQGNDWEEAGAAMDLHLQDVGAHVGPPGKDGDVHGS